MLVLGIDPGSLHTGFGLVALDGRKERLIEYGVLHFRAEDSHELRLKQIYDGLDAFVDRHAPDECAIEMPVYGRNPQSMLKLGRAQAAAMLVALNRQIPVTQYTPAEVKKSVTGNGQAAKEQVGYMVRALLSIPEAGPALEEDAADALAVALCHVRRLGHGAPRRHKNWASFVASNADRVVRR